MVVSQFHEVRRFLGRLDAGQDIAAGLRTVCKENSIASAWIQASAVLRSPSLVRVLPDGSGLGDVTRIEGTVFCPSLAGNVSLDGESLSLRLYGVGHALGVGEPVSGLFTGGEVVLCEFLVTALDDAAMVRQTEAPAAGFGQWVQLKAGTDVHVRAAAARATLQPAREASHAYGLPPPQVSFSTPEEDESSELNILDMREGDWLDHPRFGVCRVVHAPLDDKVSIRLTTGKHVDLHLGVMRVLPPKQVGGRRIFQIEVRRKAPA